MVGNFSPEVAFPLQAAVARELTVLGSCASAGEYGECLELIGSGAVQVDPLISAVVPLEDGETWFERGRSADSDLHKVILEP